MTPPAVLATAHGVLPLPAFFPDATRAVVRAVDGSDLAEAGIGGVYVNVLHLADAPGLTRIEEAGGIHRFMGWSGPVVADSGGFQLYSRLARSRSHGAVDDDGFTWRPAPGKRRRITPESSVADQLRTGADGLVCLDLPTHPDDSASVQRESVRRTVAWAWRCRDEFVRRTAGPGAPPLLFAVVQGGDDPALRRECAERLVAAGFDGYGFGGWPVDGDGGLVDGVGEVARLTPAGKPRLALGIGGPANVVAAARLGYRMFDCTLPTRDARHRRLYVMTGAPLSDRRFYDHVRLDGSRHARETGPVEAGCDCRCCRTVSRAYLSHLFEIEDALAWRLATIHNLRFYARLFERLRAELSPAT